MGRIILIGATKGGVGKTVSTYNLAYSLASFGKKVLAVDFDSQANLTTCFGVEDTAAISTTITICNISQLFFGLFYQSPNYTLKHTSRTYVF